MVPVNLKHWKAQILLKGSTLTSPEASKKNCAKGTQQFTSQTTENYNAKTSYNVSNDFSNVSEEVTKKILHSLDTSKAAGFDQIPSKFTRNGAEGTCST